MLRSPVRLLAVALALLAAPGAAGAAQAEGPATVSARPSSQNLIVDGNAEAGLCSHSGYDDMTSPGWTITAGAPEEVCFQNTGGFPHASTPGARPGSAYFGGGARGDSVLSQTIDVSGAAQLIDSGQGTVHLAGWLGGESSNRGDAEVVAMFMSASGNALGSVQIGPVTAGDRHRVTAFQPRTATAAIPPGTRSIAVELLFTWQTGAYTTGFADDLSLTVDDPALVRAPLVPPPSTVPRFDHVFLVFMENENLSAASNTVDGGAGIIGNPQAPYINRLARANSLLTDYSALTHYSDPNYFGLAAGTTFGHTAGTGGLPSNCVDTCVFHAPSLADRIDEAGESWKEYEQGARGDCDTTQHGYYYPDDAPFLYFARMRDDPAYCRAHMQPLTAMFEDLRQASTTPSFSWFAANDCRDMESCGIASGDEWLAQTLPSIFASPAWRTQRSLLIVTWDEDGNNEPGWFGPGQTNLVPAILIGSQDTVKHGFRSAVRYDHYSTARTIEAALGLRPLTANDAFATPINDVFTGT